jgi:hypothetical protein
MPSYRSASLLLPAVIVLLTVGLVTPAKAKDVKGGQLYTSKTKLFTVRVPETGNSFVVMEDSTKGDDAYEEVAFYKKDSGKLYRLGVRRLGSRVRSIVPEAPPGELPGEALSFIVLFLHYGGRIPGAPAPVEMRDLTTPHGDGVLAVNRVEGGSTLSTVSNATAQDLEAIRKGRPVGRRDDTYVVVGVVRKGDFVVYASAQNDLYPALGGQSAEKWQALLTTTVEELLRGMTFLRPVDAK